jgi:hypothetical protein
MSKQEPRTRHMSAHELRDALGAATCDDQAASLEMETTLYVRDTLVPASVSTRRAAPRRLATIESREPATELERSLTSQSPEAQREATGRSTRARVPRASTALPWRLAGLGLLCLLACCVAWAFLSVAPAAPDRQRALSPLSTEVASRATSSTVAPVPLRPPSEADSAAAGREHERERALPPQLEPAGEPLVRRSGSSARVDAGPPSVSASGSQGAPRPGQATGEVTRGESGGAAASDADVSSRRVRAVQWLIDGHSSEALDAYRTLATAEGAPPVFAEISRMLARELACPGGPPCAP